MKLYLKFRRIFDPALSFIIAIFLFYAPSKPLIFHSPGVQNRESISYCLIETSASLLGFILAASTFLISYIQTERFSLIRRKQSYEQLSNILSSTLWRLFYLMIFGVLFFFFDDTYFRFSLAIATFFIIFSMLSLATSLYVVLKIYSLPIDFIGSLPSQTSDQ